MKKMFRYETYLGAIGIAESDGAITNLWFPTEREPVDAVQKETAVLNEASVQLSEYLKGKRKEFSVPLAPAGTPFQQKVWECLLDIPYGRTMSYGEIAKAIGSPKAARAVGMANHRNPISIFIPCHRVIGASGGLVGYMAGLDFKKRLLDLESGSDVRAVSIGLEKEEREEHATSVQKTRSLC